MSTIAAIHKIIPAHPVMEGAGVRLNRVFAHLDNNLLDPFLLLDHFGSHDPNDYIAGFPWHPHRGIETVTYMLSGRVEHQDSLGNKGVIGPGDVQWMTAGGGIVHQEMPQADRVMLEGFQLWVNLPARHKMMTPRYQGFVSDQIPSIDHGRARIKVICGTVGAVTGPVKDLMVESGYLDIELPGQTTFDWPLLSHHTVFAYVFRGQAHFAPDSGNPVGPLHLVHFSPGDTLQIKTEDKPCRFLLVFGEPIHEPIAWGGPIVMNTKEELDQAFADYQNGTFIKS